MTFDDDQILYTKLYGIVGTTSIPKNKYSLTYFQTSISSRNPGSAQYKFLKELVPVRDRMKISEIQTMDDVLQRDIDDSRIARDMIPYLMETKNKPVFFPSILVVLMPRENLTNGVNQYPKAKTNERTTSFGSMWKIKRSLSKSGNEMNIAELDINLDNVHPIVIDGQHRTTAFRWLANIESTGSKLHDNFYKELNRPKSFLSDLPVTILWFSTVNETMHEDLDIKRISRDLFTDINQSSQQISRSRNILMNNSSPSSFITRKFYDYLSKYKFSVSDQLTLFYSGFDFPFDASGRRQWAPNSIFIPEILDLAMQGQFFGNPKEQVDLTKDKSTSRTSTAFKKNFEFLVGRDRYDSYVSKSTDLEGETKVYFKPEKEDDISNCLKHDYFESFYEYVNTNGFYCAIFDSFKLIDQEFINSLREPYINASCIDAWNTMYLAGEGVYYTVNNSRNRAVQPYRKAAGTINKEFHTFFAQKLNLTIEESPKLLAQIQSVAYIQGYISAVNTLSNSTNDFNSYEEVLNYLAEKNKQIDWSKLAKLQLELSESYLKNIDPKSWPSYRNVFLRALAEHYDEIYDIQNHYLEARVTWYIAYNKKLPTWCDGEDVLVKEARSSINKKNWKHITKEEWLSVLHEAKVETTEIFMRSLESFYDFDPKCLI